MSNAQEPFFGRTDLEWEELEAAGWELLAGRTAQLTTYTGLNRALARITGQAPWDFANPADRNAMAHLLGRLTDRSYSQCLAAGKEPIMISALCTYMNENDAGDGFYRKALELHLITENMYKDRHHRFEWWAQHVAKVQGWLASTNSARDPLLGPTKVSD
jgi:hypothetical protein